MKHWIHYPVCTLLSKLVLQFVKNIEQPPKCAFFIDIKSFWQKKRMWYLITLFKIIFLIFILYAVLFMLVNLAWVQQAWPNQRALDTILRYGWMTYAKDQCVLNTIHVLLNSRIYVEMMEMTLVYKVTIVQNVYMLLHLNS